MEARPGSTAVCATPATDPPRRRRGGRGQTFREAWRGASSRRTHRELASGAGGRVVATPRITGSGAAEADPGMDRDDIVVHVAVDRTCVGHLPVPFQARQYWSAVWACSAQYS